MKPFDSVMLIGAGGTGAVLAPLLARFAEYHPQVKAGVTVIDADRYEEKNMVRQPIGAGQVNMNKAEWVKVLCEQQGLKNVISEDLYVDTPWLSERLKAAENHLIVCAVDNNATRKATLDALEKTTSDFAWFSPANADDEDGNKVVRGQVLWWARQQDAEYGKNPATIYDQIKNPDGIVPRVGGCFEHAPSAPQLLAANALAAAYTMAMIQGMLDKALKASAHGAFFNGTTMNSGLAE